MITRFLTTFRAMALVAALAASPHTADAEGPAAVVLMYHRFGEDRIPSTNIRLDQVEAHIRHLTESGFTVLPLADIVAAFESGQPLPPKALAITIDDAYTSVFTEAWPRFKRAGFPFTVFVATAAVDRRETGIMTWDQLRTLAADGVTIGGHGHAHPHMPALSTAGVAVDLAEMNKRFVAELGVRPTLFAYPYGEAADSDKAAVKAAGYVAAFGQNSGPAYAEADRYYLPRFALNETYGALERFKMVVATRPLRAVRLTPSSPVLVTNPPILSFSVVAPPDLRGLSCFGPNGLALPVVVAGTDITVTPTVPFPAGRARVNCTVRAAGAWFWWGHEMLAGGISEGVRVHPRHLESPGR
jgi:peptidoglycan/xylan/chitin deacetylase (PgdA/CDA1 family)